MQSFLSMYLCTAGSKKGRAGSYAGQAFESLAGTQTLAGVNTGAFGACFNNVVPVQWFSKCGPGTSGKQPHLGAC